MGKIADTTLRTRCRAAAALCLVALVTTACASRGPDRRAGWPPPYRGPGRGTAGAEAFRPGAPAQPGSAMLVLPGTTAPQRVPFANVGGVAVMEGDIVLGPTSQLGQRYGVRPGAGGQVMGAVVVKNNEYLWPGGIIPYELDASLSGHRQTVLEAIARINETELEVIPRRPTDTDYVVFREVGEGCNSHVGRIGGAQTINSDCYGSTGSVMHEILHSAGFFHEQSRSDRDAFITIVWEEIDPAFRSAFERHDTIARDVGAYDYGSLMHYGQTAFSIRGNPTIIPTTPGVRIGQREGLSSMDRATVTQLYAGGGLLPPGLQIPGLPAGTFPQLPGLPPMPTGFPVPAPGTLPALPAPFGPQ
ncbi:MAG: M12 family metallopeptidase [Polyangiaceae bacterium]